jgi:uncharacterized membrane protein
MTTATAPPARTSASPTAATPATAATRRNPSRATAQALDADDPKALIMRATVYARLAQVVALHELAAAFREIGYAVAHAIANIPTLHRDGRGEGRG